MSGSKSEEFASRIVALCKEFDARMFARSDGATPMISVVFGHEETPWIDYRRINADAALQVSPGPTRQPLDPPANEVTNAQ